MSRINTNTTALGWWNSVELNRVTFSCRGLI